jgi:hypothetical protein
MYKTAAHHSFALALALASCAAVAAPKTVVATYAAYMQGLAIGTITERLETEGATYRITSDTQPTSLASFFHRQPLRVTSQGRLTAAGLQPLRFEGRRRASDDPQVSADFDWSAGRLVLSRDGNIRTLPLDRGTQDRLSIMYHFMFAPIGSARRVEFAMTNGRKLDHYRYAVAGEPVIETPLGRLKTIHLVKERDPGDTAAEIWLSPEHGRLAVRLVIVERNGVRFEQIIQSVQIRD